MKNTILHILKGRLSSISVLTLTLTLVLFSCSKKEDVSAKTISEAAGKAVALTDKYIDGNREENDSRLFLANMKELVENLSKDVATVDSIVAVPVTVIKLKQEPIASEIQYLGDIQSSHSVKVYTKFPDKIRKYYVEVGDYVKPQQPLVQISNAMQAEGLKQAKAGLNSAKSQYENMLTEYKRMEKLFKENAVSIAQFDQIKTQKKIMKNSLDQARAGYNTAKKNFDDALVKAPITGYITERNFEIGDMAPVQIPLVTISKIGKMKIIVNIIEKEIAFLKKGGNAIIEVTSYEDRHFQGKITKISPVIDPQTRTGKVEIEIDNSKGLLKAGMFARVRMIIKYVENAWVINKDLLTIQSYQETNPDNLRDYMVKKKYLLYTVKDNISLLQEITPGIITRDKVQILDGISPDDLIIKLGRNLVRDSSLVNIIE
ncbi:MAG: efflux RND transporter periplasmic adaptor subunit [Candidatus Marinimicrobia bacterium]|nr:efflux RND transporter periplasmic adaptor subunit [Candidatus Neomarinimicrobiota bacterium]